MPHGPAIGSAGIPAVDGALGTNASNGELPVAAVAVETVGENGGEAERNGEAPGPEEDAVNGASESGDGEVDDGSEMQHAEAAGVAQGQGPAPEDIGAAKEREEQGMKEDAEAGDSAASEAGGKVERDEENATEDDDEWWDEDEDEDMDELDDDDELDDVHPEDADIDDERSSSKQADTASKKLNPGGETFTEPVADADKPTDTESHSIDSGNSHHGAGAVTVPSSVEEIGALESSGKADHEQAEPTAESHSEHDTQEGDAAVESKIGTDTMSEVNSEKTEQHTADSFADAASDSSPPNPSPTDIPAPNTGEEQREGEVDPSEPSSEEPPAGEDAPSASDTLSDSLDAKSDPNAGGSGSHDVESEDYVTHDATSSDSASSDPASSDPARSGPAPPDAALSDPGPSDSAPSDPAPSVPAPSGADDSDPDVADWSLSSPGDEQPERSPERGADRGQLRKRRRLVQQLKQRRLRNGERRPARARRAGSSGTV